MAGGAGRRRRRTLVLVVHGGRVLVALEGLSLETLRLVVGALLLAFGSKCRSARAS